MESADQLQYDRKRRKFFIAYPLWAVLGIFGAHRFYFGKFATGVLQFALTVAAWRWPNGWTKVSLIGVIALWMLIDAVSIPEWVRSWNAQLVSTLKMLPPVPGQGTWTLGKNQKAIAVALLSVISFYFHFHDYQRRKAASQNELAHRPAITTTPQLAAPPHPPATNLSFLPSSFYNGKPQEATAEASLQEFRND